MSILRGLLILVSVVAYRVWFPDPPPPGSIRLDYDLLVVALVGLYRSPAYGTVAGWVIGFLASAGDPGRLAWGSLLSACLGWTVAILKERLFLEYPLSRWLIFWTVLLVWKSVQQLLVVKWDLGLWIVSFPAAVLASAGLTATVGVVVSIAWERTRPRRALRPSAGSDGG
jgi:hypothetical protein